MKKSIFAFAIFQLLLLATACNQADRGAPATEMAETARRTDAYAPPAEADLESKDLTFNMVSQEETPQDAPPPPPPPQPTPPQGGEPQSPPIRNPKSEIRNPPIPRQIIKTADYRIQVKDVNASSQQANALATKHGGYISDSELRNTSYVTENILTIRVPASRFDSLLNDLGQQAIYTEHKRISSQDVTEEYVDITTRLKTKIAVRDRYVDILRTKAKTVKDVLAAEEQIRIIQEEIEAKEGRLRYIKDQVGMSTISLQLFQEIEYRPGPDAFHESFWTKLTSGLKNGWELMQGIVIFFVNIWPLLILGGLLWWKRRWVWGKIRRNQ